MSVKHLKPDCLPKCLHTACCAWRYHHHLRLPPYTPGSHPVSSFPHPHIPSVARADKLLRISSALISRSVHSGPHPHSRGGTSLRTSSPPSPIAISKVPLRAPRSPGRPLLSGLSPRCPGPAGSPPPAVGLSLRRLAAGSAPLSSAARPPLLPPLPPVRVLGVPLGGRPVLPAPPWQRALLRVVDDAVHQAPVPLDPLQPNGFATPRLCGERAALGRGAATPLPAHPPSSPRGPWGGSRDGPRVPPPRPPLLLAPLPAGTQTCGVPDLRACEQ